MVFSYGRKGLTDGLERELVRRKREGEEPFEYFAHISKQKKLMVN